MAAEARSKVLDGAWREEWQKGDEVIAALATRDDLNVVDLGAGTGYFTKRMAKAIPNGKVLALEPETTMIEWIDNLAAKEGLKNITTRLIATDDPKLEEVPFKFDILLVGYVYHHLGPKEVRVAYFREKVQPKMPEDALLVFVDFEAFPDNPPADLEHAHKHHHHGSDDQEHGEHHHHGGHGSDDVHLLTPETLKEEMTSAGFTFVKQYDFLDKPNYMVSFKVTKSE